MPHRANTGCGPKQLRRLRTAVLWRGLGRCTLLLALLASGCGTDSEPTPKSQPKPLLDVKQGYRLNLRFTGGKADGVQIQLDRAAALGQSGALDDSRV